jgi:hypothetical protein
MLNVSPYRTCTPFTLMCSRSCEMGPIPFLTLPAELTARSDLGQYTRGSTIVKVSIFKKCTQSPMVQYQKDPLDFPTFF